MEEYCRDGADAAEGKSETQGLPPLDQGGIIQNKGERKYTLMQMEVDPPHSTLPRQSLRAMAQETVHCCEQGIYYTSSSPEGIDLPIERAVETTWLHPSTAALPKLQNRALGHRKCVVSIAECGTMTAAETLVKQGFRTCLLNFASAKNPGGGFLKGANAQEEALARVCGLYSCLLKPEVQAYYIENGRDATCVYTDNIIVSPDVPVFRQDDGDFLSAPFAVGIITAPAPNMGVARQRASSGGIEQIKAARRHRMVRVLTLCAAERFDALVLGAWGCGVFRNEPAEVAEEFKILLEGSFCDVFPRVVFAVIDKPTCSIFQNVFSGETAKMHSHAEGKKDSDATAPVVWTGKGRGKPHELGKCSRKARRWAKTFDVPE